MFKFPVGIQLFNRPDYSRQMLESIQKQTLPVNTEKLYIFIDGFRGSIYENDGANDLTEQVELVSRQIFPTATIVRHKKNLGMANLRNQLQSAAFSGSDTWAAFFEEDIVLDMSYLQELSDLITIAGPHPMVSKVSCFQIQDASRKLIRGINGFYPGKGTQAIAERKTFFLAKQAIMNTYISLISNDLGKYSQFKDLDKAAVMANQGLLMTYLQHDSLEEQLLNSMGQVHVVTKPNLATDIGIEGVHNYTTSPILFTGQSMNESIVEKRRHFEIQLDLVLKESVENNIRYFKEILFAYHLTRSRKLLLKQLVRNLYLKKDNRRA